MKHVQERTVEHKGKTFSLKVVETAAGYTVAALLNGKQVSPTYSASFEVSSDYFIQHKESIIEKLLDLAQSDIEQEMYLKF
jgi:hypothetical protein